jgi:hypothetical protein
VESVYSFNHPSSLRRRRHRSHRIGSTDQSLVLVQYTSWVLSWKFIDERWGSNFIFTSTIYSGDLQARQNILLRRGCLTGGLDTTCAKPEVLPLYRAARLLLGHIIGVFTAVRWINSKVSMVKMRIENTIFRITVRKWAKIM